MSVYTVFFGKAADLLTWVSARVPTSGITISNFNVQSIGNRSSSYMVKVTCDKLTVSLKHWRPARDASGYKGEVTAAVKANSGAVWQKARTANFEHPDLEAVAWLGYLVDQLLTGKGLSGESAFKVGLLDTLLKTIKPKVVQIEILVDDNQKSPFVFKLNHVRALVNALRPRWDILKDLPAKTSKRQARTSRTMTF